MEPNNLDRGPNPSIQTMKSREMIDQQVSGESSSKGNPLPVDPSTKRAFDHLTKSQASGDVCLPGSINWKSVEGRGSKFLKDSDIEMEMGVTGHENGEQIGVVVESVEPRVRLPVMTQGIFNFVAIAQFQDELEDAKKELDKQKAKSVLSKDEIILPKIMSLPQLMEMFPAVGDQIDAKMDQKLSDAREEYEMKFKRLQDEHNDELLRIGAVVSESESKLHEAEEKLSGLAGSGQRYPNASFRNVLPGIQNSHGPSRNNTKRRKRLNPAAQSVNYQAPQAFAFGSPAAPTNPFRNNRLANGNGSSTPFTNPFRNNGLANRDGSSAPFTNPFRNNGLANRDGSSTPLTNPFRNNGLGNGNGSLTPLANPFRLANGDGQKRRCDEPIQPEFGRDVKRVKIEQI
ncbi:uncharacterized protein EAE98_003976 [Botrytis deweyae]|uniref:Inhibitor of growth protein N-terminal histone-binding domain-containing protein n=1 Tax=Botrytis deweyae TaxID=2478750 RepID=A0ABQ7IS82_9HELO|nr:uncharacterized protein EAE98_003976 [Botrytis deweyae]KAF7932677.1 hypothetical protein EAE98_003976 [Botrytis deweyae]